MATEFQQKVYQALSEIPAGSVTTYADLARSIGHECASRAVGSACATNPQVGVVPCHRAVQSSGQVGSYIHGTQEKIRLLREEGVPIDTSGKIEHLDSYLHHHFH